MWVNLRSSVPQRKVFTTPLLAKAKSDRNTEQFTKKKSRCQRGGVHGVANQYATTERTNLQTKRYSKDEAAALRKNYVGRLGNAPTSVQSGWTIGSKSSSARGSPVKSQ